MKKQTSTSILTTRNLSIGYEDKLVAKNINLNIHPGELIAVIGVNGSGKSTLLKTITKELEPTSGEVFLEDTALEKISAKEISEKISIVLTETHFSKNLSVKELIALGRHPYTNWLGVLSQQDKEAIYNAIELIDLQDLADRKCSSLSDGQLQKVMLARALAQDTPLIILDEPTTHLDLYHKAFVLKLLKKLSKTTQKAIVFATHEIDLALQLCDQIILINDGKVFQQTPEELIKQKHLEHLFPSDLIQFDAVSKSFKIKS
ncbi:ABC transporter ATP-binding protein [Mesonia ostreae]|uniref:ABC transporter ATP-binding protein n=1 Tax=Mesonia ostreae TaxID=861110 RepID=A0ABU2KLQ7_9FLAO|nr:ABC transporter ATP-binding protein [Mesonia ostreae]MDT0295651.1 ABC transporter ATP-binding protein [Mesonia ostreae]